MRVQPLDDKYKKLLDKIALAIEKSPEWVQLLEHEDEETYKELRKKFEPYLAKVHHAVAVEAPLQLFELEDLMLDDRFAGLFLPRILAYTILRGSINDNYKFVRPVDRFEKVLRAIVQSPNFEFIVPRIGQTIELGFALSSNVWVNNFIESITQPRIQKSLQQYIRLKYKELRARKSLYHRYKRQFKNYIYETTPFPENAREFALLYQDIIRFLKARQSRGLNHTSYILELNAIVQSPAYHELDEYIPVLYTLVNYITYDDSFEKNLADVFNALRKKRKDLSSKYFEEHLKNLQEGIDDLKKLDERVYKLLDKNIKDDLLAFYEVMHFIHTEGYLKEATIEAINTFYQSYPILSDINESLRMAVFNLFRQYVDRLNEEDYIEFFEFHTRFRQYIDIFQKETFRNSIKKLCYDYLRRTLLYYRRLEDVNKSKEAMKELKRLVKQWYSDQGFGFFKDKEINALFSTKRKHFPINLLEY